MVAIMGPKGPILVESSARFYKLVESSVGMRARASDTQVCELLLLATVHSTDITTQN